VADEARSSKSIGDAAGEVRRAFVWFGTFAAYLVTTVGATTHEQLLKGVALKLPLLDVDLPIVGFYLIAPVVFVLLHGYLLLQLYLLAERVRSVPIADRQAEMDPGGGASGLITQFLLGGLGGFRALVAAAIWLAVILFPVAALLFVQIRFLPYHSDTITAVHRALVLLDLLLVIALWGFTIDGLGVSTRGRWLALLARLVPASFIRAFAGTLGYSLLFGASFGIAMFCLYVAVIPEAGEVASLGEVPGYLKAESGPDSRMVAVNPCDDDPEALRPLRAPATKPAPTTSRGVSVTAACAWPSWQDAQDWRSSLANLRSSLQGLGASVTPPAPFEGAPAQSMLCLTYLLFEAPITPLDMRRNLIVRAVDFAPKVEPGRPPPLLGGGFDLRGRDLRFADFTGSRLDHADLRGANLFGAQLIRTSLEAANLGDIARTEFDKCEGLKAADGERNEFCRTLARSSTFADANLRRARLTKIDLQTADLRRADLTGANLAEADLAEARLGEAMLHDAAMSGAWLDRADLGEARLVAAKLDCARARRARLLAADLSGAAAGGIRLTEANLREARLVGTYLGRAKLLCADLAKANLTGADLRGADLRIATLPSETSMPPATAALCAPLQRSAPARIDLADLRAAWLNGSSDAISARGRDLRRRVPTGDAPDAELPPEIDQGLYMLYADAATGSGLLRSSLLNRIERDWQDGCQVRAYQTDLARQILAGACEPGDRFSPREWWLLQLASRQPEPTDTRMDTRCVAGPPPTPPPCEPKRWRPVDSPP
jgi:uncharacterized protein YjbI with pentapeptide repeats